MSLAEDAGADAIVAEAARAIESLHAVKESVARVIIGQDEAVSLTLTAILCGGHALLVGAPGLAKTKLVATLATALGLDSKRVQFTPDLMPADIIGSEVLETGEDGTRAFRFVPGPIFCRLLMADEINRASPRTQSALLQGMQEGEVTVAGQRHDLPRPFHVLATQNPIEQEGTYPLPEAQLDRFLFQVDMPYPSAEAERAILRATTGVREAEAVRALDAPSLSALQRLVRQMPIGETVAEMVLTLVRAARPETSPLQAVREGASWGPGPRAGQALMLGARARALLNGRLAPSSEDVLALAEPTLKHRMALSFAARADGVTLSDLIDAAKAHARAHVQSADAGAKAG